jgi:predicted XRE-type DNA-binding protein
MRQREVARRVGISQSTVNENKFHPYHIRITLVQGLKEADYPKN